MSGPSKIYVWNLAFTHIGQKPVESDTEQSRQRLAMSRVYDEALRDTLKAADWGFARVTVALALVSDYTPLNFTYAYAYPSKSLAIRKVTYSGAGEDTPGEKYKIEYDPTNNQEVVITDLESAYALYTYEITDTTKFSPSFVAALSHNLAAKLAVPLNGDKKMAEAQVVLFNGKVSEAKRLSESEKKEDHPSNEQSDYVDARG